MIADGGDARMTDNLIFRPRAEIVAAQEARFRVAMDLIAERHPRYRRGVGG